MSKINDFIINKLIINELINENDKEIYDYALSVLLCLVAPYIFVTLLMPFTKIYIEGYIMIVPFTLLRRYCGGYHFSDSRVCCIVSFFYLWLFEIIGINVKPDIAFTIISITCLWLLLPIGIMKGNNLDKTERRKRALELICIICVLSLTSFSYYQMFTFTTWLNIGIVMTFILQIPVLLLKIRAMIIKQSHR